jgi:hypothetical protein
MIEIKLLGSWSSASNTFSYYLLFINQSINKLKFRTPVAG